MGPSLIQTCANLEIFLAPTYAHVVQNHMHVHVIYIYRDVIGCRVNIAEFMSHFMWF